MIRIHYSNRLEDLVGALASSLPPPGDREALFDGPWVVVPGRPTELYLGLELARRRGIAGNIATLSVEGIFARLCARDLPDVVLIERGHIVGELLAALSSPSMMPAGSAAVAGVLGPLRRYLLSAGPAAEAVDRRRVDLARALGTLFAEWSLTRPDRIEAWRAFAERGEGLDAQGLDAQGGDRGDDRGDGATVLERAERALWTELFGRQGRFARRGTNEARRYLTLDDVLKQGLDAAWRPPAAIHVFGVSRVPAGLQLALSRLARRTELALYAVNPCREFWEDVSTRRRPKVAAESPATTGSAPPRRRRGTTPATAAGLPRQLELGGLFAAPGVSEDPRLGSASDPEEARERDNPFLRAWGHAGRESTRLLNQLSDGDFDATFVDPAGGPESTADSATRSATLLQLVQQDILDRHPERDAATSLGRAADGTLQVVGAPSPRRELESIAAEIWAQMGVGGGDDGNPSVPAAPNGAPLRFSDVAVLIAGDDEPYLSLARAVFREASDLPHAIVDQPVSGTSPLIEAILGLLDLALGRFTRREVLDVITHPNVLARFPEADPEVWLQLCEGLAIVHGSDQSAHANTYVDGDLFNWDQGLKRLALGILARGPRSGAEDPIILPPVLPSRGDDHTGYIPAELTSEARDDAESLGLLVRSLMADARFARATHMPLADWMRFVRSVMAAYVIPLNGDDEAARLRVHAALDQLADEAPPDLPVALGPALELVRAALTGLRTTRGQILGAGVAVGRLSSLRSLPFRVIFVAGLGADRFPSAERSSPLEADPEGYRAGDVTIRQHDRYLFLETMLAARDALILSHVDRDAVTGEPWQPSPLIVELLDQLRRGYLRPDADITRRLPLHRDEDPRVLTAFPAAADEARARVVGADLRRTIPRAGTLSPSALVESLSPATREVLSPLLRTIEAQRSPDGADLGAGDAPGSSRPAGPRILQLADLRRFLECPLQGSARIFLGLRDLPDDTLARQASDEPFEVPRWLERGLLGEVLARAWGADPQIPGAAALSGGYHAALGRARHAPLLPAGLFRDHVRRQHLEILEQWIASLAAGADPPRGPLERVCFGRPDPRATPATEHRPPICLTVELPRRGPTVVELHGTTEPLVWSGAARGSLVLATSSDRDRNNRDSLRAFLDHMALAASRPEGQSPAPFRGAICRPTRDGKCVPPVAISFGALEQSRARDYLGALVTEMLGGVHDYLFPCEAVFRSWDGQMSLVDRIDQVRADKFYRDRSSSAYGPVPDPFEYPTPPARLAARYAETRFGLLAEERPEPRPRTRRPRT